MLQYMRDPGAPAELRTKGVNDYSYLKDQLRIVKRCDDTATRQTLIISRDSSCSLDEEQTDRVRDLFKISRVSSSSSGVCSTLVLCSRQPR